MVEEKIGVVEHFFSNINVAAIKITEGTLKVGETIHIVGASTDVTEKVQSMQIQKNPVMAVKAGDDVGIKLNSKVHEHDVVYKVPMEQIV
jgi:putative protease